MYDAPEAIPKVNGPPDYGWGSDFPYVDTKIFLLKKKKTKT